MRIMAAIAAVTLFIAYPFANAQPQIAQSDKTLCDLVRTSARTAMTNRQSGMDRQQAVAMNHVQTQSLGDSSKEKFTRRLIEQTVVTVYENERISGRAKQNEVIEVFGRAAEEVCLENIGQQ